MAGKFNPLGVVRRRPVSSAFVAAALALVLLLGFARYWVTTDAGRDFVMSQIEGRDVAGYGKLSVRKLEGDPLSDFSLGSIQIRDGSGTWLSAKNIKLKWSPFDLLSRRVELIDLSISDVSVTRRPVRAPRPKSEDAPWGVRIGDADIARLFFAEGVAGPEAAVAVSARFLTEPNGSIDAQLQISPLEGAGDRIDAHILRDRNSAFDLKVESLAPAGGLFAHLLQLPADASATVSATAAGDLEDGRGEARLSINGTDRVFFSAKIENRALDAGVRIDASALPIPENVATFIGNSAEADVTVKFEKAAAVFNINSRISAGTISVSGRSRLDRLQLEAPARLKANLETLEPFWTRADTLALDGTFERRAAGFQYVGEMQLALLPGSGLPLQAVSGPVTLSLESGRIPFTGDVLVQKAFASNSTIAGILGDEVRVSGNGVYEIADQRLLLDAAEVTHRSGTLQLLGEAGLEGGDLNLSGKIVQSISVLPGGFGGTASGFVQAKGNLSDVELGLNLSLESLSSKISALQPLIDGRGTVRGMLQLQPKSGNIKRLQFRLPGIEGELSGRAYGDGSPDLRVDAQQTRAVTVSGNQIDLGAIQVNFTRQSRAVRLQGRSRDGSAVVSGRSVSDLAAEADLLIDGNKISGPVRLTGRSDGQPSKVSFRLERSANTTSLRSIEGNLGTVTFSGSASLSDDGALDADIDASADKLTFAGITFGSLRLKGAGERAAGNPFDIGGEFEARKIQINSRLVIDEISGTLVTTPEGYRFAGRLIDEQSRADSDLGFSGLVNFANGPPSGRLSLSGALLGIRIATSEDIVWTLGPAPTVDADVALLGGRIQARLRPGTEENSSSVTLKDLSIAPLLAAFGYPAIDAVVSGEAKGRLYGENPEGVISLSANSPLSGLDTAIDFDLTGRLDRRALSFSAQSTFGPAFKANAAGRLPVATSSAGLVRLDRTRAIEALVEVGGDLKALQLIALAYGQDIGGDLKGRVAVSGTLENPAIDAEANVTRGSYEYGATGFSLKDVVLDADFENSVLTLKGTGAGTQGGTLSLAGRLAESEAGVSVKLNKILVYDRLGDQARLTGDARLVEGVSDRVLSGALSINEARFNIDNFADESIRTLNVRWTSDEAEVPQQTLLNKPIRLDLTVSAPRGILVKGRGLDSDWGVNLAVTGRPDSLLLNGRATLNRGSLELAQRPFEFETGQITFDGPLDTARMEISATRDVDGFSVRADVSGAPANPTIALSSNPSLPDDEILSRMLFGRSAVDLSALEAAELASSIARLSGRETGLDPIGAIQSGLGVDRLRFGVDAAGNPELGVGQYLAPDVYLEVTTQGAAGNSVEVEWQPRPQVSVSSETSSTGDSRVSVRWKKDY